MLVESDSRKGPSKLVDLISREISYVSYSMKCLASYPIDQGPVPCFNQEREFVKDTAQGGAFVDAGIWRCHTLPP